MVIVKKELFENVECDFYERDEEIFMTSEQLGRVLGYSTPRESINKLISRNEKLRKPKFSVEVKLTSTDGKSYNTRLFNEDGIYEITFLSNTEKAEEFRDWVREILKSIRKKSDEEARVANEMFIYFVNRIADLDHRTKQCEAKLDVHTFFVDKLRKMF